MTSPIARSDLGLELARLDTILHRQILRLRAGYAASANELRGLYISDAQVDHLVRSDPGAGEPTLEALERSITELEQRIAGNPGPLDEVARRLGFDAFTRDAVLLGAAPDLDAKYTPLIAYLNNDVTLRWPTIDLALRLFALPEERRAARAHLAPTSPLFRRGILERVPSPERRPDLGSCYATAAPIALALAGVPPRDSGIAGVLADEEANGAVPAAASPLRAGALADVERRALVVLRGERGEGTHAAARALFASLGRGAVFVDGARLLARRDAPELVDRLALVAHIEPSGIYVDLRGVSDPAAAAPVIARLASAAPGPLAVAVASDAPWRALTVSHPAVEVACGEPDAAERAALWSAHLAEHGADVADDDVLRVAERFPLGRADIAIAAREAVLGRRAHHGDRALAAADLLGASKARLDRPLGRLAVRLDLPYAWDDLVLPADTEGRLRSVASAIEQHHHVLHSWGFSRRVGSPALVALFSGASGTGKTMTAAVIANAVGLDLYRVELATVVSKYIGETEKNLDRIFAAAHRAGVVLLFDEADALFGKRSEVKDAHDRYANLEIAYLLQKLETHDGVVFLASNLARNIDRAFSRRMSFVVEFPRPDEALRRRLWAGMFPAATPLAGDVDLDFLASHFELTGGDIRTVALDAAYAAAADGAAIAMRHLVRATARQLRKQGTAPSASQFKHYYGLVLGVAG